MKCNSASNEMIVNFHFYYRNLHNTKDTDLKTGSLLVIARSYYYETYSNQLD